MYATFVVLVGLMMLAGVVMGVDPRVKGRKGIVVLVYYAVLSYFSIQARADTVFLTEVPGNKMTKSQALKTMVDPSKSVYKCKLAKSGPNGGPVFKPGAKVTWHSSVGGGIENVFDLLAEKKKVVKCVAVHIEDNKLKNLPQDEEGDDE